MMSQAKKASTCAPGAMWYGGGGTLKRRKRQDDPDI
jgi:hypothetical protein